MDFSFTEEQLAIKQMAREFADREVAHRVREYDRTEEYPLEIAKKAGELGMIGGAIPEKYGGSGMDFMSLTLMTEELGYTCQYTASIIAQPSCSLTQGILRHGSEEIKMKYVYPLAKGQVVAANALTEPHSGTDIVRRMETTVTRDGDDYIVNGTKAWISNLPYTDWAITYASIDKTLAHRGLCALIIEMNWPGVSWRRYHNELGQRPFGTGDLFLDNVRVPKENLIGEEYKGHLVLLTGAEVGRLMCAARALGGIRVCIDESVKYAQERIVFGQPIGRYQLVQSKITDMVVGYEAARLITYKLAWTRDQGVERIQRDAAVAKLLATDVFMKAATDAVQIHGAYGVSDEYVVGRFFRDAKVLQIVDGTNEIQKVIIAEHALGYRQER